jgi:hypothetical protein
MHRSTRDFMVISMRRTSGWRMIGTLGPRRRRGVLALHALLGIGQRLLVGALGHATPCRPTPRRASFIMMNMYSRPRFSSPTGSRWRPGPSPKP